MAHLTPKAVLSVRAMQNLLRIGWPNKGLLNTKAAEFHMIQKAFETETGRGMTVRDLQYKGESPNGKD